MRKFSDDEIAMLESVNDIGFTIDSLPNDNFIFIQLEPYLDNLMVLLKQMNSNEMFMLFTQYEGVMKVMCLIEDGAQQMERDLGSR